MKEANLTRKKNAIITFWLTWDKLFNSMFSLRSIDGENKLLHYRIRKYRGRAVELGSGVELKRGDQIAELHLNNRLMINAFADSRSSVQLAVRLLREVEPLLPKLSRILKEETDGEIKALYGVSMIYRGTKKLGFNVIDIPAGPFSFFTKFYLKLLLVGLHPQGRKRMQIHPELWKPKIIAMPVEVLHQKYSEESR